MIYDPLLRKEVYHDEIWYGEFLIFHNIGVCQVPDKHANKIREALARFRYATKTMPGKRPGSSYIIGSGEIGINDVGAYIQEIRGEKTDE